MKALKPVIDEIATRSGTAGLTYGIIYRGTMLHTDSFGYRDVDRKLPVDEDTVFQVASLTKSMIAAAIGMLVEENG